MDEQQTPIAKNRYIEELFSILQDNGKDTSGLASLLTHVQNMEDYMKSAETRIADMKSQLESMREIQNHPIKTKLQNAIKSLESKVADIKERISELKSNIVTGCKNGLTSFREKGISALDKLASFFHIKSGLQAVKNDISQSVTICDKSVADINAFAKEYHSGSRHFKNMARIAVGKKPIDTPAEIGKLARALSAPYRAEKSVLLSISNTVDVAIGKLEQLELRAKKPTLKEQLDTNKERAKQQTLESPVPERVPKSRGVEL